MRDEPPLGEHQPALVRTRYAETDQMGFVYHSHFFAYFEVGRCDLVRQCGTSYAALEAAGIMLPLRECGARFRQAARYDDLLAIGTRVAALTPVRIRFDYQVHRLQESGPAFLAEGFTDHFFIDRAGRPIRASKRPEVWSVLERVAAFDRFPALDRPGDPPHRYADSG